MIVKGKGGISATIVADSISEAGQRITTYELEYPRFIHSEFMTHRQFSRNAASSRAIPIEKVIEQVENNPAIPIHWGKNQSGMQAKEEININSLGHCLTDWCGSAEDAATHARWLSGEYDLHKQIVNRILEPYQFIKVVCTATEYENFFYLRNHADAQPEIQELARCMQEAMEGSYAQLLLAGEWHLPYLQVQKDDSGTYYYSMENDLLALPEAIKISASLCAQVSYRKSDESLEKALKIYDMLVGMKPVHASPFEHQATPIGHTYAIEQPNKKYAWKSGITHRDRAGEVWSGNFKGWIQNRQLIKDHVYTGDTK